MPRRRNRPPYGQRFEIHATLKLILAEKPREAFIGFLFLCLMSKILSELRTHTRVYLDETSEADWLDSQLDRAINYAYMELFASVIETYEDYYTTETTTPLVAGQRKYSLPDRFYKIRRLEVKYSAEDTYRKAHPYNMDVQRRGLGDTTSGTTNYPQYFLTGNFLNLNPIPSESVDAGGYMLFIKQPPELALEDDAINIPFEDRYAGLIPLGAAGELLRKGQQEETVASKYLDDFRVGLEKMKQELEDRTADESKSIIDVLGDWNDFGAPSSTSAMF
jgi:hypothetical protein